ncbi:hypothetical protein U9M48_011940 [Paspalum notatum var. saurae]|uniref:Disease resistance protein At4g27190-like leucine-rich repeats domain-containing protein n=1 Tax=Paspalum notatum var. saurae TaxID=547442 RepID=A0AAQ3SWG3_PASNO
MCTQVFVADTIEEAVDEILQLLKEDTNTTRNVSSRDNVFYFDGWDGLGASAVLRAVAQRLTTTSPAGLEFDQVIHIDCSIWESRRALQRLVAEQLKLPDEVMELFDRQDEKDDFKGVAQGPRDEIPQVITEIYKKLNNSRFLVIFHNGSSEEIDLASCCGFPLSGFSTNKVLWTFQGRFRLKPRAKVDAAIKSAGTTDHFLSATANDKPRSYFVQQEAMEVAEACKSNTWPAQQVCKGFLYMLQLCCRGGGHHSIDYDFSTHVANYWVCDGIIQQGHGEKDDDSSWRAADALQREMPLDMDYHEPLPSSHISELVQSKPYWSSPTHGFTQISPVVIPSINGGDMLQYCADKLCVLKLSRCTFDFQSPPFLCCNSLRFLWLDHCQGTSTTMGADDEVGKKEDICRCFQRLWVLDVRYTDCGQILSAQMMDLMTQLRELNVMGVPEWDIGQLQGRLPNIRKLRVTKSIVRCSGSEKDQFSEMNKMELLDFSGNYIMTPPMPSLSGPGVSSNNSSCCLETVTIVDGCDGNGIQQISFRGCTNLKNILLGGTMWYLRTIDISGTSVKTLDLTRTIMYLDELYLLGCEKLRAILWPPKDKMKQDLSKLCIDTTQQSSAPPTAQSREGKAKRGTSTATTGTSSSAAELHEAASGPTGGFGWYISVEDARLLSSLEPVYSSSRDAYVEVSSIAAAGGGSSKYEGIKSGGSGSEQPVVPAIYKDIAVDHLQQQASEGGGDALGIVSMWPCPDAPQLPEKSCYIHLHDQMKTDLQRGSGGTSGIIHVPDFAPDYGKIMHVHDSLSITRAPSHSWGSEWYKIEWCRIERCPKLDSLFDAPGHYSRYNLSTFWASQLIKARYIWTSRAWRAFPHLMFLHLDLCPRLIDILPLSKISEEHDDHNLHHLETLEIAWCGDLREIFPWQDRDTAEIFTKDFPGLKRIHLHELPSLRAICGVNKVRMSAPNLEAVKIRGCWSLRRLPYVKGSNKAAECDCEKDWWDMLEWEDASHMGQYRPIHPRYYKKKMLRGSVLSTSIHYKCVRCLGDN